MKTNNHKFQILFLFRFFGWTTFVAILLGIMVTAIAVGEFFLFAHTPTGKDAPQILKVPKGNAFYHITQSLKSLELIDNVKYFSLMARLMKADTRIHSGTYRLSPNMSPCFILTRLMAGDVELTKVVFPEGYTIDLMAETLEKANILARSDFMIFAKNPNTAKSFGIHADSLEGYLFPDTYHFVQHSTPEQVVETMLKQFWTVFDTKLRERASEIGLTIHETVTFASIVEKETGQAFERPKIASVFHNRLKRNMRLESDPTVIYGIPDFDGNLTRKHLKTTTPYNTYRIKGLPHGPIANPGKEAIYATLYPEKTNFLYFVSKQDGTHQFSTNLKSHNRAVNQYQRKRKAGPSKDG